MLAGAGGILGAALAAAGLALIKRLMTIDAQGVFRIVFGESVLPRASEVGLDIRLVVMACLVTGIATLAFGLLPAVRLSRTNHLEAMGSRGAGAARRDTRVRNTLVIAQVAMATMLLVGAGLLVTSFARLVAVDKGYDPDGALAFQLVLPADYPVSRKAESIEAVLRATRASRASPRPASPMPASSSRSRTPSDPSCPRGRRSRRCPVTPIDPESGRSVPAISRPPGRRC